jgi:DNA polymerase-3 subunit beta
MKIQCSSEKVKNALLHAERVTGKNLTLPILSSVLCIASGTTLKLRATNLSLGIEIEIPAKVEKEGVVAVSGTILSGFFASSKTNEEVTIELVGETLLVKTKTSRIQIKTFAYEDFPTIPTVDSETIKIPATALLDGLESVYYSAAQTDIKPEIGSVYVYPEDDQLTFVATDSFRLAEKKVKIKGLYGFQPVLIPYKNVVELMRILAGVQGELSFKITKTLLAISFDGYYITSRVVDGVFPDYRKIFPKEKTSEIILLKSELQNAIKTSTLFSDKFNQISLTSDPEKKTCVLSAKNSDVGENEASLDGALSGEPISIVINYRYLLDCLNALPSDSISIDCTAASRPILVRGVGDTSFIYLIMPMNR